MRVEPAPYVFRNQERRQRPQEDQPRADRRQSRTETPRAQHAAPLPNASFAAHLLGQVAPQLILPRIAARAYSQPEARTPLRPRTTATA